MTGNRWFVLSLLCTVGAFVLAWVEHDPQTFAAVASVALGGGHLTNVVERWASDPRRERGRGTPPAARRRADTDIPEAS
jgi:hypothetical protein